MPDRLDYVHQHVGREPSGLPFNSLALKAVDPSRFKNGPRAIPHNTMINSGAIMICALLMENQQSMSKRFKSLLSVWKKLFGDKKPDFSNSTYLSEKETASRNWCLTYMMQDAGCFPSETNLKQTLDFYFQTCAIEADTERMATLAAALAAGGVNPFTDERIFKSETVRNCLSLMLSTGMRAHAVLPDDDELIVYVQACTITVANGSSLLAFLQNQGLEHCAWERRPI